MNLLDLVHIPESLLDEPNIEDDDDDRFPFWLWTTGALFGIAVAILWLWFENYQRKLRPGTVPTPRAVSPPTPKAVSPTTPPPAISEEVSKPEPEAKVVSEPEIEAVEDDIVIPPPPEGRRDDLSRLKGVGPKTRDVLKDLGVVSFAQIAAMPSDDLQRLLARANVKRVNAEAWSAQAKELMTQRPVDDLKVVKGIGPKIEKLLNDHDIFTFAELAEANVEDMRRWLDEMAWDNVNPPDNWPEQARQLDAET